MSNEIKWIKLSTELFNDEKIKVILSMEDGSHMVNTWIHLLCLAGKCNNVGLLTIGEKVPYSSSMIASVFNEPEAFIKEAVSIFQSFNMIDVIEEGNKVFYAISNWSKYQSSDALENKRARDREYQRMRREEQRNALLHEDDSKKSSDKSSDSRSTDRSDKSSDTLISVSILNKSINKDNGVIGEEEKEEKNDSFELFGKVDSDIADSYTLDAQEIMQSFGTLPHKNKLTSLSDLRKRNLKKAIKQFSKEKLLEAIDVMRGNEPLCQKSWSNFDWFLRENSVNGLLDNTYEWMKNEKQDKYSSLPKLKYLPEDYDSNDPDVHEY